MRKLFVTIAVASLLAGMGSIGGEATASAQQTAVSGSPAPEFDVASVRPAAPIDQATIMAGLRAGKRPENMRIDNDRVTFKYMSLKQLVAYGYKLRAYQVNGPQWMTTDRFDIAAKLPAGASSDDVPAMLQALLVDRFKLAAHLETKQHPVLGLMLTKSGSKMKEVPAAAAIDVNAPLAPGQTRVDSVDGPIILTRSTGRSTIYNMGARGTMTLHIDGPTDTMSLEGSAMTMKGLASILTTLDGGGGRQVVDMTGLLGHYDITVVFALSDLAQGLRDSGIDLPSRPDNGPGASDPSGNATMANALNKLGLRLQGTRADVQELVVDHVEKEATPN